MRKPLATRAPIRIRRLFALSGALLALFVSPLAAEKPVPVSCLYLRDPTAAAAEKARGTAAPALVPTLREKAAPPAPDSLAVVVVLVDWTDQAAQAETNPPSRYEREYFRSTAVGNETTHDYYREVSGGRFRLGGAGTVWLRSALPYGHYVNGDGAPGTADDYGFDTSDEAFEAEPYAKNVWGIVREAAALADAAGLDFSLFDSDGPDGVPSSGDDDGIVDALIVVHAGAGAERVFDPYLGPNQIWSHKSDLNDPAIVDRMGPTVIDGVRIGPYNLVPEIGQTGVYAHEFGHILGLPDLYRTYTDNGSTLQESTIGAFCLMDAGSLLPYRPSGAVLPGDSPSHLNPFFKSWLGWLAPDAYESASSLEGPLSITLAEAERGGGALRLLANPGGIDWNGEGDGTGEYFLLENRQRLGFDSHLPGSGLLVWHVAERRPANESGDFEKRLLGVVETEGAPGDLGTRSGGGLNLGEEEDLWPYADRDAWTTDTEPSTDLHGGAFSGVNLTEIRSEGTLVSFTLELEAVRPGDAYAYPNPFEPAAHGYVTIAFAAAPDGSEAGAPAVLVYDLGGFLVRSLDRAGDEIVRIDDAALAYWDGRNDGGNEVASGVYLYVIAGAGDSKQGKIALLR